MESSTIGLIKVTAGRTSAVINNPEWLLNWSPQVPSRGGLTALHDVVVYLKTMERNRPLPSVIRGDLQLESETGIVSISGRSPHATIVLTADDISAVEFPGNPLIE